MKKRYVIRVKDKDAYLTNDYYKPKSKSSYYLEDAHLFSAFELLLARKTVLKNKGAYVVYGYEEIQKGEVILDVV